MLPSEAIQMSKKCDMEEFCVNENGLGEAIGSIRLNGKTVYICRECSNQMMMARAEASE